jgi:hypothetical protein
MIRTALIFILLLPFVGFSQGFDWQVSSRHPYQITDRYIGLVGGLSYNYHVGDFPFLEQDIVCCNYEDGTGLGVQFGLGGEFWYQHDLAFSASLTYSIVNADFRTETTVAKKVSPDLPAFNWTTAYKSEITLNYINLDLAIKKRIYEKLNLKAGIDIGYHISTSEAHKNVVVEPENVPFSDGTFEKDLSNGRIGQLSTLVFGANLGLSYDINLGIERYGEVSALGGYTLNNLVKDDSWHNVQARLVLKAYLGIR